MEERTILTLSTNPEEKESVAEDSLADLKMQSEDLLR
jgi:hypothetical protein